MSTIPYLCVLIDEEPERFWTKVVSGMQLGECPKEEEHTACPRSYVAWHTWAKRMAKTHCQSRCSGCNRWAIFR